MLGRLSWSDLGRRLRNYLDQPTQANKSETSTTCQQSCSDTARINDSITMADPAAAVADPAEPDVEPAAPVADSPSATLAT